MILILVLFVGIGSLVEAKQKPLRNFLKRKKRVQVQRTVTPSPTLKPSSRNIEDNPQSNLEDYPLLSVDFTSQAPFGFWDKTHNDACEEAAIVMVYSWVKGIDLNPQIADKEILKLVDWQKANFGFFKDTNARQTAEMAQKVYGLESKLISNPTLEQIKTELKKGNLVVMPMAGRLLKNPYFRPPGPPYHILVIKGYDFKGFITNDPGTRRGKDYRYSFETIMNAAHDWGGSPDNITSTPAVAIVFSK